MIHMGKYCHAGSTAQRPCGGCEGAAGRQNRSHNEGATALHCASQKGHMEAVKELLDAKAETAMQSKEGWTALHLPLPYRSGEGAAGW